LSDTFSFVPECTWLEPVSPRRRHHQFSTGSLYDFPQTKYFASIDEVEDADFTGGSLGI
jgi:hypothetical protein